MAATPMMIWNEGTGMVCCQKITHTHTHTQRNGERKCHRPMNQIEPADTLFHSSRKLLGQRWLAAIHSVKQCTVAVHCTSCLLLHQICTVSNDPSHRPAQVIASLLYILQGRHAVAWGP